MAQRHGQDKFKGVRMSSGKKGKRASTGKLAKRVSSGKRAKQVGTETEKGRLGAGRRGDSRLQEFANLTSRLSSESAAFKQPLGTIERLATEGGSAVGGRGNSDSREFADLSRRLKSEAAALQGCSCRDQPLGTSGNTPEELERLLMRVIAILRRMVRANKGRPIARRQQALLVTMTTALAGLFGEER